MEACPKRTKALLQRRSVFFSLLPTVLLMACTPTWHGPSGPTAVSNWLLRCVASEGSLPPDGFRTVATLKDFPVSPLHPVYRADTPDGVIYAFRDRADPESCGFAVFGGEPAVYRRIVTQALAASQWHYKYHFGRGTDDGWGESDHFVGTATNGDVKLLARTRERRLFRREPDFIAWGPMARIVSIKPPERH